jgi:hypothetical protein
VGQPGDAELLGGLRGQRRRVAQHQRRQHRRLFRGQRDACGVGEGGADVMRNPVDRRCVAQFRLTRCRQHRDGQISPCWSADAGAEARRPTRRHLSELCGARENDYPSRYFTVPDPLQRTAEHHSSATQ